MLKKSFDAAIRFVRSFDKTAPETAFYPAALEILEEPPSPLGRLSLLVICTFFVIALVWAIIGEVDIVATAQGKIVPTGRTKVIQPLEVGVVRAIHVQDGNEVKEGDVLIEIDTTISEAERNRLQKDLISAELDVRRLGLALEIDQGPKTDFPAPNGASPEQIATHRQQLINQVQEIISRLTSLDQQIAQNEGNLAAVQATIRKLERAIPLLREKTHVRQYLSDKGYGSKLETLTTQQDLVEYEQELLVQKGRLAEALAGVAALREQKLQALAEYKTKNLDALSQAQQKADSLREQVVQANQKYKLQTLTAPVNGTVQQLAIHTEGGVVTPAQALLVIVPQGTHLEIEGLISNRDIGFVRDGQDAQIKIDTFNFTKYGFIHGKVLSVSQDAITRQKQQNTNNTRLTGAENESSEPSGEELVYAARISMEKTTMQVDDRLVTLSPGMAVTVEIKTGARHVIDFLLSPLLKHTQQSFRER